MPVDVCSPNSSGQKPKPQRPPAPKGVKHAPYGGPLIKGDSRTPLPPSPSPSSSRNR